MNIQVLCIDNNYQNLNFCGAKSKMAKRYVTRKNVTTLYDKLELKNKNKNKFVFTYDKMLQMCEKLNKRANRIKKQTALESFFNMVLKDRELSKKTCDFNIERAKLEKLKNQKIFKSIIDRCFNDIDDAVLNNFPQEKIDNLVKILEKFITEYGHLG